MALGALIGVRYAATACPSLPGCNGVSWPAAPGWSALDPFTGIVAAARLGDDGGVALHLLHRYCALACPPAILVTAAPRSAPVIRLHRLPRHVLQQFDRRGVQPRRKFIADR